MPRPHLHPLTLAFSGGGAKCAAQAGVLQVLAASGLPVGAIAGSSAGALVAVLHGLGCPPQSIRDYIAGTHLLEVWEFDRTRQAVFGADKIRARLRQVVGDRTFADLCLPVTVMAACLDTGEIVGIRSGRLDDALVATMAIPGLFAPVTMDGRRMADGGIVSPLPVDVARAMGPRVVAVDVASRRDPSRPVQLFEARGPLRYAAEVGQRLRLAGVMEVAYQAIAIAGDRLTQYALQDSPPDVVIRPDVGHIGLFAFDLADEAYRLGEAAAVRALPELTALARSRRGPVARAWDRLSRGVGRGA